MKRAAFISDQDIASVTVRLQPSPNKSYKAQLREKKLVKRLNGGESAVLDFLDSRTNIDQLKESGHRRAWPMLKTIAEKTGLSIRTVQRSIEGLSRKGFIEADGLVGRSIRWRLTIPGEGPQQLVMFEECGGKNVRLNTSRLSGSDGQSLQPNIRNEEDDKEVDKHVDSDDVDFERGDEEEDEEIRAGRILESVRPKLTPNQIAIALRYRPDPDRLEALIRKLKRDPKVRNLASYLYNSIIHGMDNAPPAHTAHRFLSDVIAHLHQKEVRRAAGDFLPFSDPIEGTAEVARLAVSIDCFREVCVLIRNEAKV